ncbi:anti sigma factor C-terminal domain-containing protein [Lentilactobacillus buchneri]|uniref:anti sigma factor C-terminal domain-containing protein n=1 Tax=Lentilactobacillus buchneri TaxID=1581 RepID=UPI0012919F2E|nr:anti sigma factor C-terminal domain-containing protein [Lentilactobacillus buchneri]MQN24875.1 anti-sigma factor [Lentilactobacillus buchneri]
MNQDKQFEKLAFRIKLKRWVITILLIIILFPIMTAVGYKITQSFSARQSSGLMKEMEIQQDLMSPNIQNSDLVIGNSNIGGGTVVSHQYKDIDGYHLPWQTVEGKYNWLYHEIQTDNLVDTDNQAAYTRTTQTKIPLFYNNRVKSPNVSKAYEVKKISQMKNYVGEVALTFRHPMTYSQILQKLPKGIQANWFWLGVNSKADPTIEDNCFLGIQSFNGKLGPNDYKGFRKSLQSAKNLGTYNSFSITDYAHGFAKKYPTLNQARFSGIIITGKTENFKPLVNQNWITESSVGATIKRVPYIKPSF